MLRNTTPLLIFDAFFWVWSVFLCRSLYLLSLCSEISQCYAIRVCVFVVVFFTVLCAQSMPSVRRHMCFSSGRCSYVLWYFPSSFSVLSLSDFMFVSCDTSCVEPLIFMLYLLFPIFEAVHLISVNLKQCACTHDRWPILNEIQLISLCHLLIFGRFSESVSYTV